MKKMILALLVLSSGMQIFASNKDQSPYSPCRLIKWTADNIRGAAKIIGENHENEIETTSITRMGIRNDKIRLGMSKFATKDGLTYVIPLRKKSPTNVLPILPSAQDNYSKHQIYKDYKRRKNSGIKYDPSKCVLMNAVKRHSQDKNHSQDNKNRSWTTFISNILL
jgi:hypothetical protein